MTKDSYDKWIKIFGRAWAEKDVDKVMSLFDKNDITYYENVFSPPVKSWIKVKKLWKVVPSNQKDISFLYEIISYSDTQAIINWKVTRFYIPKNENQNIDGIFLISLNNMKLCTFFKQWRMIKIG